MDDQNNLLLDDQRTRIKRMRMHCFLMIPSFLGRIVKKKKKINIKKIIEKEMKKK